MNEGYKNLEFQFIFYLIMLINVHTLGFRKLTYIFERTSNSKRQQPKTVFTSSGNKRKLSWTCRRIYFVKRQNSKWKIVDYF